MVGVISNNGLGLFDSSLDRLGFAQGQPTSLGQAKGSAYVNIATGNLSLQFLDETLSGTGADLFALRTYNSQGNPADGWRWGGEKKIVLNSGTAGAASSSIRRILGDGSETLMQFDETDGVYRSTAGSGAHDIATWNSGANEWVFRQDGGLTEERYDATTGWIKNLRDASGNGFNYTFTANKLTKIVDLHTGQTFEFSYGGNGKLSLLSTRTTATGALSGQVHYLYDGSNRLTTVKTDLSPADNSVTDNNVYTTTYTYEGTTSRITSVTQSDGTSAAFSYDALGRVLTVTDQTGISTFTYDANSTRVVNSLGTTWTYTYDATGKQLLNFSTNTVGGVNQSASYGYDPVTGDLKTVTDGMGKTISYDYDEKGNRVKDADSLGNTITRTFSDTNQLKTETRYSNASLTSPSGAETTRYVYDADDRLRFVISPEGRVSESRYENTWGLMSHNLQYTDISYTNTNFEESDLISWVSSLTAAQKSSSQLVAFEYDGKGNLSRKTVYANVDGNGVGVLNNATTITKYVHDEYGQLKQTFAIRGTARDQEIQLSSISYDEMGRQINIVNESGTSTTTYSGNVTTLTNTTTGLSVVTTTDAYGRVISVSQKTNSTVWDQTQIGNSLVPAPTAQTIYGDTGSNTLTGADGNDAIYGRAGNDYLQGAAGNDNLQAEGGNDTLRGGSGNDTLDGGIDSDTYLFGYGDGADTINAHDVSVGRNDILRIDDMLTSSDIKISRDSNDLIVTIKSTGDNIRINNHFSANTLGSYSINAIVFSDGTIWDYNTIQTMVSTGTSTDDVLYGDINNNALNGLNGSDTLYGRTGNDTLNGNAGNDVINGEDGDDILDGGISNDTLNGGNGNDLILGGAGDDSINGDAGNDTLRGGAGNDSLDGGAGNDTYLFGYGDGTGTINSNDTGVGRYDILRLDNGIAISDVTLTRSNNNLVVTLKNTGDSMVVFNHFFANAFGGYSINAIVFGDGTTWDYNTIQTIASTGTDVDDSLYGDLNNNTLNGLNGNDTLYGRAGNDTLNGNAGNDVINGEDGDDILDGGISNDTLNGGNGNDLILGGTGDDSINGDAGNDTLRGGAGNDILEGGTGNDTYLFGYGDGTGTINNNDTSANRYDILRLDNGITSNDITLVRSSSNQLLVVLNNTGDSIKINSHFYDNGPGTYSINAIVFGDGTTWDYATIQSMVSLGTSADDSLHGDLNNNILNGLGGNDTLNGRAGNDTLNGNAGNDALSGDDGDDILDGGISNDTLNGGNGNDSLIGGTGDDSLNGEAGNDTLRGGSGNDSLEGGAASDTYLFGYGDGIDTITNNDTSANRHDILRLDNGILTSDVKLVRSGNKLEIILNSTGDTVVIPYHFQSSTHALNAIHFGDGTIWNTATIQTLAVTSPGQADTLYGDTGNNTIDGLDGNDTLYGRAGNDSLLGSVGNDSLIGEDGDDSLDGGAGNDTLDGGNSNDLLLGGAQNDKLNGDAGNDTLYGGIGNDTLTGGNGNDTYQFGYGDGSDIIQNNSADLNQYDVIQLGNTVPTTDVKLTRNNEDLILTLISTGETITVSTHFSSVTSVFAIHAIVFGDGTVWNQSTINEKVALGTSQQDKLYGDSNNNTIDGFKSDDTIYGQAGNDSLIGNAGNDSLLGEHGDDTLEGEIGNDTLHAGNGNDLLLGGAHHDTLNGDEGNDTLYGGTGNDLLSGGNGNDIFQFGYGDGSDTINNHATGSVQYYDVLQLSNTVSTTDVKLTRNFDDLILTLVSTGDNITIYNHYSTASSTYAINAIAFGDGTIWDQASINNKVATGTNQQDKLYGDANNNTIEGLDSNDSIYGQAGNDILIGNTGNDSLSGENGDDSLDGGTGNDTLNGGNGNDLLIGGSQNDNLNGDAGNDTLSGSTGNDSLTGGTGNDTYEFNYGDGSDTISNYSTDSSQYDVIQLGSTIPTSDVKLSRSNNNLILTLISTGDNITIFQYFQASAHTIQAIAFGDGTIWDQTAISAQISSGTNQTDTLYGDASNNIINALEGNDTIYAGAGNDSLIGEDGNDRLDGEDGNDLLIGGADKDSLNGGNGNDLLLGGTHDDTLNGDAGNDTLRGGTGNDSVTGGAGNDVYLFGYGDGNDVINNSDATVGRYDVLKLDSAVVAEDVKVTRVGNNLVISLISTGDSVTVTNHFTSATSAINGIEFSNERTIQYIYNDAGQLRMTEDASGARSYLFYDHTGRVNGKVDASGAAVIYTHDNAGRVKTETHYANRVNTSGWFNGVSVTAQGLNIGSNITLDSTNDRVISYDYDDAGRLSHTTQDGIATLINIYDGASRLIQTQQGDRITKYYYDADGRQRGVLNAERELIENVYDNAGRLIKTLRYETATSALLQLNGSFNDIRNSVDDGEILTTYFFYDNQGRPVGVVDEQGFLTETRYDAANNQRKTIRYMTPVVVAANDTLADVISDAGATNTTTVTYDNFGRELTVQTQDLTTSRNEYDAAGRLVRSIQADGSSDQRATRMRYNAYGEITGVVSGVGEAPLGSSPTSTVVDTAITNYGTRFDFDYAGRKVTEYGPQGQKTFLFYNTAGQLTYTVNALGEVAKLAYNAFGQVESTYLYNNRITPTELTKITSGGLETKLNGKLPATDTAKDSNISSSFTKTGQVKQTNANGVITTNNYNSYGQLDTLVNSVTSGINTTSKFNYDLLGRVVSTTRDQGGLAITTGVAYDGFGRIDYTTDANNQITDTDYENNGRTVVVIDALNRTHRITTDAFGRTLTSEDAQGNITSYSYNDDNRNVSVTTPENITITTWKTRTGETLRVADGKGGITEYTYTKDGKLDKVIDALTQEATDNAYDNSGRLYETEDANGVVTRYSYDAANRITEKAVDPTGINRRTTYEFDGQGRQIKVTEGAGTTEAIATEYKYNQQGRIEQIIIDPNGLQLSTRFSYDNLGNTTLVEKGTLSNPSQQVTQYEFDNLSRKTKEIVDPGAGKLNITTEYKYDERGNLTRVIDANGNSTWFVYDNTNQKTLSINALGNVTQFSYDKNGRLQQTRQFANNISTASFGDEVTSITLPATSDADRRSLTVYDQDGRTRYQLNAVDDIYSALKWTVTENIYDNNNQLVEQRVYDKTLTNTQITDAMGTGTEGGADVLASEMATLIDNFGYTPSTPGATRVTQWQYDALGRKTAEILDATTTGLNITTQFRYDAAGNLTRVISPNSASTWYVYNTAGQKTLDINALGEITAYEYDGLGKIHYTRRYKNTVSTSGFGNIVNSVTLPTATTDDRRSYVVNDAAGRLKYTLNALNETEWVVTENTYDAMGNVKSIIAYDDTISESQITSITPAGSGKQITAAELASLTANFYSTSTTEGTRITRYDYDAAGRQIKTTLPGWYDQSNGRVYAYQEGLAYRFERTIEVKYDALGNAISNTIRVGMGNTANDYVFQYKAYDALGRLVFDIDALGNVSENHYDNLGNLSAVSRYAYSIGIRNSEDSPWTAAEVAAQGNIQSGAKRTIEYQYDTLGRQIEIKQPSANNNFVSTVSTTSSTTPNYYSASPTTRFVYDSLGNLIQQRVLINNLTDGEGNPNFADTYYYYDAVGRRTWIIDPLKYGTRTEYDAMGNAIRVTEYANSGNDISNTSGTITSPWTQSHQRDINFIFAADTDHDRVTEHDYDLLGRVEITRRRLEGYGLTRTNTTDYNSFGDIENSIDALNNVTSMEYDRLGQLKQLTEPERMVAGTSGVDVFRNQVGATPRTKFFYNVFGERTREERGATTGLGDNIIVQHTLDLAGNEYQTIDGLGNLSYSAYNVAGKVIRQWQQVVVSDAAEGMNYAHTLERRFEYDKTGRQRAVLDIYLGNQVGEVNSYNAYGEVTEQHKVWGPRFVPVSGEPITFNDLLANQGFNAIMASYTYDNAGRVASKHAEDGITHYAYDLLGNVTRTEQRGHDNSGSDVRISETVYDKRGYATQQRLPQYAVTESFFSLTTADRTPVINQVVDRWGNVISRTDATGNVNKSTHYRYNQDNQLVNEVGPSTARIHYDGSFTESLLENRKVYDKLGRVKEEQQLVWDSATYGTPYGAYAEIHVTTNSYNTAGQLTRVVDASSKSQDYVYDIHSNRVGTRNGVGHVTVDTYNANNQVTERLLLRNGATGEYKGETNITPTAISLGQYFYDQAGRTYAEADALGIKHYYRYDERNNLISERNRVNNVKYYYYDELNHKIRETADEVKIGYYPPTSQYGQPIPYEYTVNHELNEWTYSIAGSYGSSVDFKDYAVDQLQSRQVLDKTNLTYDYSYSRFGQLALETQRGTNNTVTYSYYANGLQQSIVESVTSGYNTTSNTSTYYYDIKGNRTVEHNYVEVEVAEHTEYPSHGGQSSGGMPFPVYIQAYSYSTGQLYSYYQYDDLNRLTRVKSPSASFTVNYIGTSTTNLDHLTYDYDGFGNRRRISSSYTLPGGSSTSKEEWYSYDAAGRVEIEGGMSDGTRAIAFRNTNGTQQGVLYRYDNAGRRATEEAWLYTMNTSPNAQYGGVALVEIYQEKAYTYNDLGLVANVQRQNITREFGDYPGTGGTAQAGGFQTIESNTYDNRGFKTLTVANNRSTSSIYLGDGTLYSMTTKMVSNNRTESKQHNYVYDYAGNILSYRYSAYEMDPDEPNNETFHNDYTYSYVETLTGRQQGHIEVDSSQDNTGIGTTNNTYDTRGRLITTSITEQHPSDNETGTSFRQFAYNTSGQIIVRAEKKYGVTGGYKVQNFYYSPTGGELANLGAKGVDISPLSAVYKGGAVPGSYTINDGDTLMGIAQTLFGDAKLWYTIADANGLSMGPTESFEADDIGRNLRIPNSDKTIGNTSTNWKPYNPSEIIGDLTPNPKILPPPKAGGCGIIGTIIMVIIAVVVTIYTGGAAASFFAGGGTIGTGAAVAGAAVGAFAGSVASQAAGVAMGMQDSIDFRQAAASGIAGGITAGVGSALSSGAQGANAAGNALVETSGRLTWLGQGIQGASSVAANAVANKIVGMESNFSWAAMAAGFAGGALQGQLDLNANLNSQNGTWTGGNFWANTAKGFANGAIDATARRVAGVSGKQDWESIAANSVGNAAGSSIANRYKLAEKGDKHGTWLKDKTKALVDDFGNMLATRSMSKAAEAQLANTKAKIDEQIHNKLTADLEEKTITQIAVEQKQREAQLTTQTDAANETIRTKTATASEDATNAQIAARNVEMQNYMATSGELFARQDGYRRQTDWDAGFNERAFNNRATPQSYDLLAAQTPASTGVVAGDDMILPTHIQIDPIAVLKDVGKLALGAGEIALSGGYNTVLRVGGGAASLPYLFLDGPDAAMEIQKYYGSLSWEPGSEGATFIIDKGLAPLGEKIGNGIQIARNYSESYIGDGGTTIVFGVVQATAEIGGLLSGVGFVRRSVTKADSNGNVNSDLVDNATNNVLQEIATMPHGSRPIDPATYLSSGYIESHLAQFDSGASYLTPKAALDRWGRNLLGREDGQFAMPSNQLDDVLLKTNGDMALIEKELGIKPGDWQGKEFVRIDIPNPKSLNLRIPNGNEAGANPNWLPAGKLPTGYSEAVLNPIPVGSYSEISIFDSLQRLKLK